MTNELTQLKAVADSILANELVERHSLFQLQCFILAKEPTIQGKLQQCLREIKSRKQSLDAIELEIEEQEDQVNLLDIDIQDVSDIEPPDDRKAQRKVIQLRSLSRKRKSLTSNVKELRKKQKNISEELLFFCSAFDQLNKREKLKPWDDPDVQKEYWSEKLRFEVNTRLLLKQLPDVELMKTILCLNDDAPIKKGVIDMLKKANEQVANEQNKQIKQ